MESEADASRPNNAKGHEIGPSNYYAELKGAELMGGRNCWVLSLKPKRKSKYLIDGTVWVEKKTYALVRLEGTTASSVSMWVGMPHIVEEFAPVGEIWFPVRTVSKSRSAWLGVSELEIRYTGYEVMSPLTVSTKEPLAVPNGERKSTLTVGPRRGSSR
jgi:hypothetical protein